MKNKVLSSVFLGTLIHQASFAASSEAIFSSKGDLQSVLAQNYTPWQVANPSPEAKRNASKNAFNLVYEGALTRNEKGRVNIKPVNYFIDTLKIAANLYLPANFSPEQKYPAIIIAHPNGGVKEQVAGLFAQRLAELGFITLAFDAAYQGASEGLPRNTDKPQHRVEDIHAAADYLLSLSFVDSDKLGVLGICGGGGYTLKAAQSDKRFSAVATLSAFNTGLVRREGFLGSAKESLQSRLAQASKARSDEKVRGIVAYTASAPKKTSEAELAKIDTTLYREGLVYYGDTHAHPNSSFAYTTSSLMDLIAFDATDEIKLIDKPLLMIVGDKADTAYMSEAAFKKATGTQDKEYFVLKDTTHIQSYYKKESVEASVKKLNEFFKKNLR